ncbi:MAG: hypothetical protein Q8K58_04980 [Acidimicrobiales bacterium]|nr:hypothetical protein [Acidimicrobiales bacterium]
MQRGKWVGGLACAVAIVLVVDLMALMAHAGTRVDRPMVASATELAARVRPTSPTPVAPAPPPTTQPAPPPAEPAPPPTTVPPTTTVASARPGAWTLGPYQGVGVWLDVYDWTNEITGGNPSVQVADIDRMADLGIQTLYIQTAHRKSAADVIEPERLLPLIDQAHARGMAVVAWYLPTLEDVPTDLRRLVAAAQLPVDGLGVDIESLAVADPAERTRRLLELSTALRQAVGARAISAITPSAVHLQVVNPGFWPGFPWAELGATYDAIVPMSYWSVRKPAWRIAHVYVGENIDRIRAATGRPDMPIHVAGGIADGISLEDVHGMIHAIQSRGILGGSLYDWNTSQIPQWDLLRALRVG